MASFTKKDGMCFEAKGSPGDFKSLTHPVPIKYL